MAAAGLVAAAALAFRDFVRAFDRPPSPLPARVDLIVVLSGGAGRLEEGVRLLEEGRAPLLFLVGFRSRAVAARLSGAGTGPPVGGRVLVEPRSASTLEDAERTRALVVQAGAASVLLITSVYHMPRADLTFRARLPAGVALYTRPVRSPAFRAGPWYADPAARRVVLTEFGKFLYYRVRLALAG